MSVTVEEIKNIGFLNLSLEEKIQINLWTPFEKCLDTPLVYTSVHRNYFTVHKSFSEVK